jgi:hypothetical protein
LVELADVFNADGCVMVIEIMEVQLAASVTVTEYVPAHKLLAEEDMDTLGDQL